MDRIAYPSPLARFLSCAISEDRAWQDAELRDLWARVGDSAAFDFAGENDAQAIAAASLRRVLAPGELSDSWLEAARKIEERLDLYMDALDRAAAELAKENIRLVALKNSGIARALVRDMARNPMGDVDVLISGRDFEAADRLLQTLGFVPDLGHLETVHSGRLNRWLIGLGRGLGWLQPAKTAEEEDSARRSGGMEYKLPLPNGTKLHFELQWRPVAGRWIQPGQEPQADELLERSVPVAGTAVRLLDATDNLFQVCLHTAKHSYVRAPGFRLHTDVDRIVRYSSVDWELFVLRAREARLATASYFSLVLPQQLLRTPVPERVLAALRPAAWKARWILWWLQRVGLFNGRQKKWSKLGYIVFNLLLYDTPRCLWRGIFPSASTIVARYGVKVKWSLPYWYAVRLAELTFCRANT